MNPPPNPTYEANILRFQVSLQKLENRSGQIAFARFLLFILIGVLAYLSISHKSGILLIFAFLMFAGFLYLVKQSVALKRKISFHKILITINQEEIKALEGDFSPFDTGAGFIDYHHEYSYDLDIFGEHSIYRMVNRAATPLGKTRMAGRLLHPGTDTKEIRNRQESVRELVSLLPWRQDFLATARESDWEQNPEKQISSWLDAPDQFTKTVLFKVVIWINAIISLTILFLTILTLLSSSAPQLLAFLPSSGFRLPSSVYLYFLVPIGLIISRTRIINREQQRLERLLDLFRKYAGLLQLIENEDFTSGRLNDLKEKLKHGDKRASDIMKELTGILWGLEVRGNLIVSFFLNSFFLWDILLMIRLEKWRRNYGDSFGVWIDVIAEFEALNSLANLSYNRPDLTWPEIREGDFNMEIVNGGHPLINPSKRVDNSLFFPDNGRIYLITGANMAGKSTLLRMVGVNMILAMAGGPVCAKSFAMVPVLVHTSVRTNDSLGDDESYFYAELKKLSRIISRFEQGEKLFVIVDEMLKGTNSRDKHTGSAALIHRLTGLGVSGLVATHDVELGELEKEYPDRLVNRCFEVITDGDQLKFDYLLYPGVSKNLNATFLMRKMGIIAAPTDPSG